MVKKSGFPPQIFEISTLNHRKAKFIYNTVVFPDTNHSEIEITEITLKGLFFDQICDCVFPIHTRLLM